MYIRASLCLIGIDLFVKFYSCAYVHRGPALDY